MPKQKTNRAAAKRFKMTGTGKVVRRRAGLRHILSNKNRKRKRRFSKSVVVDHSQEKAIKRLLPYL